MHPNANKFQVRQAIQQIYNVRVIDVRTATVHGKPRRAGRGMTMTRHWKKAVVTLKPGHKIELIEGI